jgi:hypothetical protein
VLTFGGPPVPLLVVTVRGGTVSFLANSGAIDIQEDTTGNPECLNDQATKLTEPHLGVGDAANPYLAVVGKTTLVALARLGRGRTLTLKAAAHNGRSSPVNCNGTAGCTADFLARPSLKVKRVG